MKENNKQIIYLSLVIALGVFLYLSRAVLGPFILAALTAYLLNPVVRFLTHRTKLPKTLSIIFIYIAVIGSLIWLGVNLGTSLAEESNQFSREARNFVVEANNQITTLPTWLQPIAGDLVDTVRNLFPLTHGRVMSYLPGAVNRTVNLLVFLVATFYFLMDGAKFVAGIFSLIPKNWWKEISLITKKINVVLGNYLRGQLFLVLIMSSLTYVGLTIIGVRYSLILSIFTGLAEIIPLIGPVIAAGVAMTVAFVDNYSRLGGTPAVDAMAVLVLYIVLRQIEDLFIIPNILGRLTKLHPLVVMFAVLAGGHLFGIIGFLIAVPLTASIKVIVEHLLAL